MAARRRVILDLCSGLGGASEAFLSASQWQVVRIENNPDLSCVPHTQTLDVLEWTDWVESIPHPTVIWASPPCLEFSRAYNAPAVRAEREGRDFEPDMELVKACLDVIDYFKPEWHVIENVEGAQKSFFPLLGNRAQRIGPFYLWGKFPRLAIPYSFHHVKSDCDGLPRSIRSQSRALVPIEISEALLRSVEDQQTLARWQA